MVSSSSLLIKLEFSFQDIFVQIYNLKGEVLLKDLVVLLRALNEDIDKKVEVKEVHTIQIDSRSLGWNSPPTVHHQWKHHSEHEVLLCK